MKKAIPIEDRKEVEVKAVALKTWKLLKTTAINWWNMEPFRESAIIAYYAIFSLPALLVIIISISGFFFGADAIDGKIYGQIKSTMGAETADQVKLMLAMATESRTSIWATVFGILTVLVGSIGVFVELQKTLNKIWGVAATQRNGVWGFFRNRLFSFGLILSIAFLLIISLVISTVLAATSEVFQADSSDLLLYSIQFVNFIASLGIISFLFALMFKFLPDANIKWHHAWIGALLTGILFTIGKTALAFYFGKAEPGSGYGAAGSIILILLWTSYSSMILFLGAEFTHVYAEMESGTVSASETGKKAKCEACNKG